MEKTYTVDECVGAVNVCVNLTHPMRDILENTVNVFVIDNSSSSYIPAGASLASEYSLNLTIFFITFLFPCPAPDQPYYSMAEGTDFAQQTRNSSVIDNVIITEERKIICYNQPIYDDPCLEPDEYIGLTLGVIDDGQTTTLTEVESSYDQAAILILDNDSEL